MFNTPPESVPSSSLENLLPPSLLPDSVLRASQQIISCCSSPATRVAGWVTVFQSDDSISRRRSVQETEAEEKDVSGSDNDYSVRSDGISKKARRTGKSATDTTSTAAGAAVADGGGNGRNTRRLLLLALTGGLLSFSVWAVQAYFWPSSSNSDTAK